MYSQLDISMENAMKHHHYHDEPKSLSAISNPDIDGSHQINLSIPSYLKS
jgi:hypothetical protein